MKYSSQQIPQCHPSKDQLTKEYQMEMAKNVILAKNGYWLFRVP